MQSDERCGNRREISRRRERLQGKSFLNFSCFPHRVLSLSYDSSTKPMSSVDLDDEREEEAVCILQLIIFFALRRRSRDTKISSLLSASFSQYQSKNTSSSLKTNKMKTFFFLTHQSKYYRLFWTALSRTSRSGYC